MAKSIKGKGAEKKAAVVNFGAKAIEAESSTVTANKAEAKAAVTGKDPNKVENKYGKAMSVEQAEAVVKQYAGLNGIEIPNELKQAREVLRNA